MSNVDKRVAAVALEKMFRGQHFSICTVDDCIDLVGGSRAGQIYRRLSALHCVAWADIPDDVMQIMPVWINEVLGGPRLTVLQIPAVHEGNLSLPPIEDFPRIGK